jgi:hypothetical protein
VLQTTNLMELQQVMRFYTPESKSITIPPSGRCNILHILRFFLQRLSGKSRAASGPHEQLVIEAEAKRDGAGRSDRGSVEKALVKPTTLRRPLRLRTSPCRRTARDSVL